MFQVDPETESSSSSSHQKDEMGAGCGTQGEEQNCILGFMGKPEERHCLEGTGKKVIILRWRFKKQDGIGRSTFLWLWRGTSGGVVTEWYGVICHHLAEERYK